MGRKPGLPQRNSDRHTPRRSDEVGETVVQRIKFPPNFTMPPYTHPFSEVVTVISGDIGTNAGEKPDKIGSLLKPRPMWISLKGHAGKPLSADRPLGRQRGGLFLARLAR
jgi:hypothetical protein